MFPRDISGLFALNAMASVLLRLIRTLPFEAGRYTSSNKTGFTMSS